MFSKRQTVRCAAGNQVITLSYGKLRGKETIECLVPANPSANSFPDFAIYSLITRGAGIHPRSSLSSLKWLNPMELENTKNDTNDLLDVFSIHATDDITLFRLLTPQVCIKLKQLKGLFRNDALLLTSEKNILKIVKPSSYKNTGKDFKAFLGLAIELVSSLFESTGTRLRLERSAKPRLLTSRPSSSSVRLNQSGVYTASANDIKLIESSSLSDEEKVCQICGDLIAANYVACIKCETLYHKDCWEYNQRCATFGCLSTSYRESN
jgi:hypothetical protein